MKRVDMDRVDAIGTKRPRTQATHCPTDTLAEEFLCPITHALPVDPCTAQDGRVYERAAVETWIKRCGKHVRSPVTNASMGRELYPAIQVKNAIRIMVTSGALTGSLVDEWTEGNEAKELNVRLPPPRPSSRR